MYNEPHAEDEPANSIKTSQFFLLQEDYSAGTWINMQEAYLQEKNAAGDWKQIGYSAPGTKGDDAYHYSSNVIAYESAEGEFTWTAKPATNVTLNDCDSNDDGWKLKAGPDGNGTLSIEDDGTADDCKILTASWDNLTKGTIASTGSGSGSN